MLDFLRKSCLAAAVLLASGTTSSFAQEESLYVSDDLYTSEEIVLEPEEYTESSGEFNVTHRAYRPPRSYVSAGVTALQRSVPAPGIIVAANPAGTNFSNADDWKFDFELGIDVTLARRMRNGGILEARYFGVQSEEALQFVTPGNFIGTGFVGPAGTNFAGTYLSRLDSTEINRRRSLTDRFTMLAGFRWLELHEDLKYVLNSTVATGQYEYNNHLYGAQLGADYALLDSNRALQLNIFGKAGYYGNFADGGIDLFSGVNPIASFRGSDTFGAFVGEIGITAAYQVTERLAIRAGYQTLWLTDVALASDAASRSLLNPSLLTTVDTGDLFYHGGNFSVAYVW